MHVLAKSSFSSDLLFILHSNRIILAILMKELAGVGIYIYMFIILLDILLINVKHINDNMTNT